MEIFLIQIYEDEWRLKQQIVKSIIKQKLGFIENKISARNCTIKMVDGREGRIFCESNHLMGYSNAKGIGLYYKDDLVGYLSYKKEQDGIDIARFCTMKYTIIRGGLSRLLNYVIQLENPRFVQSFVDLRYGNGFSLETIGFSKVSESLGFQWTDFKSRFNRRRFMANAKKRNISEEKYAEELGLVKIYDAGQAKFIKYLR